MDAEIVQPGDQSDPLPWPDFLDYEPLPGRYLMTMTMENFNMAGVTGKGMDEEGMADAMTSDTQFICVTEDIERFDLTRELGEDDCTQTEPQVEGDSFGVAMSCPQPDGSRMDMRISGTGDEQGVDMLLAMRMKTRHAGIMNFGMRIGMERVGECTGDEEPIGESPF
ncbi:MAG: DUF3617 family protein [Alteraurantiacibacter sp.]